MRISRSFVPLGLPIGMVCILRRGARIRCRFTPILHHRRASEETHGLNNELPVSYQLINGLAAFGVDDISLP